MQAAQASLFQDVRQNFLTLNYVSQPVLEEGFRVYMIDLVSHVRAVASAVLLTAQIFIVFYVTAVSPTPASNIYTTWSDYDWLRPLGLACGILAVNALEYIVAMFRRRANSVVPQGLGSASLRTSSVALPFMTNETPKDEDARVPVWVITFGRRAFSWFTTTIILLGFTLNPGLDFWSVHCHHSSWDLFVLAAIPFFPAVAPTTFINSCLRIAVTAVVLLFLQWERNIEPTDVVIAVIGQAVGLFLCLVYTWTWEEKLRRAYLMALQLKVEEARLQKLLRRMLPDQTISKLLNHELVAESFDLVTIAFIELVDFVEWGKVMAPMDLVGLLNTVFLIFDKLTDKHRVFKVESIGHSYVVAGGLPELQQGHAGCVADLLLAMTAATREDSRHLRWPDGSQMKLKIGMHCGPVVAGVLGSKLPRYRLFGDTVNTASRMCSTGTGGLVHASAQAESLLRHDFILKKRGVIEVKGKGPCTTFWVEQRRNSDATAAVIIHHRIPLQRGMTTPAPGSPLSDGSLQITPGRQRPSYHRPGGLDTTFDSFSPSTSPTLKTALLNVRMHPSRGDLTPTDTPASPNPRPPSPASPKQTGFLSRAAPMDTPPMSASPTARGDASWSRRTLAPDILVAGLPPPITRTASALSTAPFAAPPLRPSASTPALPTTPPQAHTATPSSAFGPSKERFGLEPTVEVPELPESPKAPSPPPTCHIVTPTIKPAAGIVSPRARQPQMLPATAAGSDTPNATAMDKPTTSSPRATNVVPFPATLPKGSPPPPPAAGAETGGASMSAMFPTRLVSRRMSIPPSSSPSSALMHLYDECDGDSDSESVSMSMSVSVTPKLMSRKRSGRVSDGSGSLSRRHSALDFLSGAKLVETVGFTPTQSGRQSPVGRDQPNGVSSPKAAELSVQCDPLLIPEGDLTLQPLSPVSEGSSPKRSPHKLEPIEHSKYLDGFDIVKLRSSSASNLLDAPARPLSPIKPPHLPNGDSKNDSETADKPDEHNGNGNENGNGNGHAVPLLSQEVTPEDDYDSNEMNLPGTPLQPPSPNSEQRAQLTNNLRNLGGSGLMQQSKRRSAYNNQLFSWEDDNKVEIKVQDGDLTRKTHVFLNNIDSVVDVFGPQIRMASNNSSSNQLDQWLKFEDKALEAIFRAEHPVRFVPVAFLLLLSGTAVTTISIARKSLDSQTHSLGSLIWAVLILLLATVCALFAYYAQRKYWIFSSGVALVCSLVLIPVPPTLASVGVQWAHVEAGATGDAACILSGVVVFLTLVVVPLWCEPNLRVSVITLVLVTLQLLVRAVQTRNELSAWSAGVVVMALGVLHSYQGNRRKRQNYLQNRCVVEEQELSRNIVNNLLPDVVARELESGNKTAGVGMGRPVICKQLDEVSIMFADMVGFTAMSAQMSPEQLVSLLQFVFNIFDDLAAKWGVYKVETIGDCYFAASGVPTPRADHALALAMMALEVQERVSELQRPNGDPLQFRVGLHTGPVVAGVVGFKMPRYHLFGENVVTANAMESAGGGGGAAVNVTASFKRAFDAQAGRETGYMRFTRREETTAEGEAMFWLSKRPWAEGPHLVDSDRLTTALAPYSPELSVSDLRAVMQAMGYGELPFERLHALLDADSNGTVSHHELMGGLRVLTSGGPSALRFVFDLYDADFSGSLDRAEVEQILQCVDVSSAGFADELISDVMKRLDTDGDGMVTWDEFRSSLQSGEAQDSSWLLLPILAAAQAESTDVVEAQLAKLPPVLSLAELKDFLGSVGLKGMPWRRLHEALSLGSEGAADRLRDGLEALRGGGEGALRFLFELYDVDHSGQIVPAEFAEMLKQINIGSSGFASSLVETLFARVDANEDNSISWSEFQTAVETEPMLANSWLLGSSDHRQIAQAVGSAHASFYVANSSTRTAVTEFKPPLRTKPKRRKSKLIRSRSELPSQFLVNSTKSSSMNLPRQLKL